MKSTSPMNMIDERLPWSKESWERIHRAVIHETQRVEIAPKFLPCHVATSPEITTIPSDVALLSHGPEEKHDFLNIDEAATFPLNEIWTEFTLTPQQVAKEDRLKTAYTLAIRATNFVSRGEDILIFQGQAAIETNPLFSENWIEFRSGPAGTGLLGGNLEDDQEIRVLSQDPDEPVFRERTLAAVTEACARLKAKGHYGPYALVLHDIPYGDTFSLLPGTLIKAIERLQPMLQSGIYGTGTMPEDPHPTGVLVSLEGNTMDLVTTKEAHMTYLFDDEAGLYRFRVSKRFVLRFKDTSSVIKLIFETPGGEK